MKTSNTRHCIKNCSSRSREWCTQLETSNKNAIARLIALVTVVRFRQMFCRLRLVCIELFFFLFQVTSFMMSREEWQKKDNWTIRNKIAKKNYIRSHLSSSNFRARKKNVQVLHLNQSTNIECRTSFNRIVFKKVSSKNNDVFALTSMEINPFFSWIIIKSLLNIIPRSFCIIKINRKK